MEFAAHLEQIRTQLVALLVAAERVGPDAPVPSCPEWTVQDLLAHQAKVHRWATSAVQTPADGRPSNSARPPEDFVSLPSWATEGMDSLVRTLADVGPDHACWVFTGSGPATARFWARRQAHETAMHRLDAELAAGDPPLLFDPVFAADGIDELLSSLTPAFSRRRKKPESDGKILVHAADAGELWVVRLTAGEPPTIERTDDPSAAPDVSVVGTADAVYRAVWGRPSHAVTTGDTELLAHIAAP